MILDSRRVDLIRKLSFHLMSLANEARLGQTALDDEMVYQVAEMISKLTTDKEIDWRDAEELLKSD